MSTPSTGSRNPKCSHNLLVNKLGAICIVRGPSASLPCANFGFSSHRSAASQASSMHQQPQLSPPQPRSLVAISSRPAAQVQSQVSPQPSQVVASHNSQTSAPAAPTLSRTSTATSLQKAVNALKNSIDYQVASGERLEECLKLAFQPLSEHCITCGTTDSASSASPGIS